MIRRRVIVALSTLLLLGLALVVVAGVMAITQTPWGRAKVRELVLAQLHRAVHGRLYIGHLDGNLFTNLTIDSLEIRDQSGQLLVAAGRVHAEYDPRDLLDRRILFQHLELDNPTVHLVHHFDETWNFQRIFPPSPPSRIPREPDARGFGDFIVANNVVIRNGAFSVTERWRPDDSLHGARRDSAITEALHRPYYGVARTSEGLMRTLYWKSVDLTSPYLRIVDPDSAGVAVQLADLDVNEFFPPFNISRARGRVTIVHDTVRAALPHLELPGSLLAGGGSVAFGHNHPPQWALRFRVDTVSLADIDWLFPKLPSTGGGHAATLEVRSDRAAPEVIDFIVSKLDMQSTSSRLRGDVTFESGRPELVIKNYAIETAPVDFELIKVLGGGKPFPVPWAGYFTGFLRGSGGPLSRWRVDTVELTLHDTNVPGATSRFSGSGELNVTDPSLLAFHGFRLTLGRLDLRTPQYVLPEFPRLHGVVSGTALVDSVWNDVRFTGADLTHFDGNSVPDRVTGSGRFTLGDSATPARYDMALQADPVSFTTLARSYPSIRMRGEFSGPVSLVGTLNDLEVNAQLSGSAGAFTVTGRTDLTPPGFAANGTLAIAHLDARSVLGSDSLPQTDLTGHLTVDLHGDSLAALDGPVSATLARSSAGHVLLDTARFVGRFGGGRFRIDSLSVDSRAGSFSANGGIGLTAATHDSLSLVFATDSLGGLRTYLASGDTTAGPLAGAVQVSAALTGWIDSLALAGSLSGAAMKVAGVSVRGLSGTFALPLVRRAARGSADLSMDGVSAEGVTFEHLGLTTALDGTGGATVGLNGSMPNGPHGALAADVRQNADSTMITLDTLALYTHDNAWHLAAPVRLVRNARGTTLGNFALRGAVAGLIRADALLPRTGPIALTFAGDSVPLADLGELGESGSSFGGLARWQLEMSGTRAHPTMQLQSRLTDAQDGDFRVDEVLTRGEYADQRLTLHTDLLEQGDTLGHALVSVPIDLALQPVARRMLEDSLSGSIHVDSVNVARLAHIYPSLQNPTGAFAADLKIGGTTRHPVLNGGVRLINADASFARIGVRFQDMQADLRVSGDSLAVRDVTLSTLDGQSRGRANLRGWLTFADLANPHFDLTFTASNLHALNNPRVADIVLSTEPAAPIRLTGNMNAARLEGAMAVDRGAIFLADVLSDKKVISLGGQDLYDLVDTSVFANRRLLPEAPSRLLQHLTLDNVRVGFGDGVWLKSDEANINLTTGPAPLIVTTAMGPDSTPGLALSGVLLASHGSYRLNLGIVQRTFTVDSGSMRFTGTADINPYLHIVAGYVVRATGSTTSTGSTTPDIPIRVILGGTVREPTITLASSDTLLTQADLLSYLVTGQQSFTVGQGAAGASFAQIVLPTLGTALGSRLSNGWLDYVNVQTPSGATTGGQTYDLGNTLAATRIGAGKQFGRSTFVSADLGICAIGAGAASAAPPTASQIGVRLDQQLTQSLTLSASSEPGTAGLYCQEGAINRSFVTTPRQWGLDFYHTWHF